MGQDADAIRREIERTRDEMAGTVDALAYKSDVKERTKDKVRDMTAKPKNAIKRVRDNVMGTIEEHALSRSTMHDVSDAVHQAPSQVATNARRVGGVIRENPLGVALGGLAVGFVAGLVLPSTKLENEHIGPMADQLKDAAIESGQELLEHGKELAGVAAGAAQTAAQDAVAEVKDAVKEEAPDHVSELTESAKDKASDVRETVGSGSGGTNGSFSGSGNSF